MQCPKCGSRSVVLKTIHKKDFTVRYRKCISRSCNYRFTTKEEISSNWNFKSIVKEIKRLVDNIDITQERDK